MSMDPELWLQQCRIFQNKEKEAVTLPYANDDNFYNKLDRCVLEGYKLKISFLHKKLANGSLLLERIISCFNGQILIDDYKNIYGNLHDILEFTSHEHFLEAIMKCAESSNKIYKTYLFKYNATPGEEPILCLEPAGEGLPSSSFTIDI
jgi:hypothetical protein